MACLSMPLRVAFYICSSTSIAHGFMLPGVYIGYAAEDDYCTGRAVREGPVVYVGLPVSEALPSVPPL